MVMMHHLPDNTISISKVMVNDKRDRSAENTERLSLAETAVEHAAESADGRFLAGRRLNVEALNDLCQRIESWKGHDVTRFGDLLLHDEMKIVSNTRSGRSRMV